MKKFKFSIKAALIFMAIACIPSWWLGNTIRDYRAEQLAIKEIRKITALSKFDTRFAGPGWVRKIGIQPEWMHRVWRADLPGFLGGNLTAGDFPVEFTDDDFMKVAPHIRSFARLKELYLTCTVVSDDSMDALCETMDAFTEIRSLNLQQTQMTSKTVHELEDKYPQVKISYFHEVGPHKW